MLNRYERGWHYRGILADLEGEELDFLRRLAHANKIKGTLPFITEEYCFQFQIT